MTISVSKVEDIMPPIIGTAMRCIHLSAGAVAIGSSPAMMAATIRAGHNSDAQVVAGERLPFRLALGPQLAHCIVE
jgi:hypothetical protein